MDDIKPINRRSARHNILNSPMPVNILSTSPLARQVAQSESSSNDTTESTPVAYSNAVSISQAKFDDKFARQFSLPVKHGLVKQNRLRAYFVKRAWFLTTLLAITVGVSVFCISLRQDQMVVAETKEDSGLAESGLPSSTKLNPEAVAAYKTVTNEQPKTISSVGIGLFARVLQNDSAQVDIKSRPKNIYDLGWYSSSAEPADPKGVVLVVGYGDKQTGSGALGKAYELKKDEQVLMERGDGRAFAYRVVAIQEMSLTESALANYATPISAKPGLNILVVPTDTKQASLPGNCLMIFTERL